MGKRTDRRTQQKKEFKKNVKNEFISTVFYIIFVMVSVFLILNYVGQRTVVNGSSMCETLQNGENLIMDKLSYHIVAPKRFDIVIFPGPDGRGGSEYYIKRVVGLPGETVQILDGKVYINDQLLEEDIYGITDYIDDPGSFDEAYTLSEDEYFCMGDNRPVSKDSRDPEVGPVKKSEIVGKVWIRIWPLNKFGNVDKIYEEYQ